MNNLTHIPWISATSGLQTALTFVNSDVSHTTGDGLTIGVDGIGTYLVTFSVSISGSVPVIGSQDIIAHVFVNETIHNEISSKTTINTLNFTSSMSGLGNIKLNLSDKVTLRFISSALSPRMTITNCSLNIARIFL